MIDPFHHTEKVASLDPDVWIELDHPGHYQDVGSNEESEILAELSSQPWRSVVDNRYQKARPWLHQIITDPDRSAFLQKLPLKAGGRYLDVGSGWGQIAIPLSTRGDVYCLDLTIARIRILREIARQEMVKLKYLVGNFLTFPFVEGQFDAIILNGSLEYMAASFTESSIWDIHRAALQKAGSLLAHQGVLYVGIENAFGLKYVLGAPDDHTNVSHLMYLDEGRANTRYGSLCNGGLLRIKTWSLGEYRRLFAESGLRVEAIYACFPDYKILRSMVPLEEVNHLLEHDGPPFPEHSGVDGELLPQNESLPGLYRGLGRMGLAEYFCPSYGFVARLA